MHRAVVYAAVPISRPRGATRVSSTRTPQASKTTRAAETNSASLSSSPVRLQRSSNFGTTPLLIGMAVGA